MLSNEYINTVINIILFGGMLIAFFQNRGVRLRKIEDIDANSERINKIEDRLAHMSSITERAIIDQNQLNNNLKKIEIIVERLTEIIHSSQTKQAVFESKLESIFDALEKYANKLDNKK